MSSGNLGSLLLGAAIGAGIGFYLNSVEGKKWRSKKIDEVYDLEAKIEEKVQMAFDEMKAKVNKTATKVKDATEPK